jgi:hypothetical protein
MSARRFQIDHGQTFSYLLYTGLYGQNENKSCLVLPKNKKVVSDFAFFTRYTVKSMPLDKVDCHLDGVTKFRPLRLFLKMNTATDTICSAECYPQTVVLHENFAQDPKEKYLCLNNIFAGTFHSTCADGLQAYELQRVKNIRTTQREEPLTGNGSSDNKCLDLPGSENIVQIKKRKEQIFLKVERTNSKTPFSVR